MVRLDQFPAAGAASRDVEWSIQNARLVVKRAQMSLNLAGRDRIMADNVKWTADENPKSKMVLWVHNLHVAMGGFAGDSLGSVAWFPTRSTRSVRRQDHGSDQESRTMVRRII